MTKKKTTKRALLMSALSLLLCVSMLVGSTFAWFTDSVTSAGNKIQAGTLKIDLEVLQNGVWASIKESQAPIFTYENWEPGFVDVKILKVENEGSLALKWVAKFVSTEALSDLANVIDVYVLPSATELTYPADRNLSGYTKVGTVAEFVNTIEETTYGSLTPMGTEGAVAYLGIALKMQESAGNEYQSLALGAFDIQILATQLEYESDSFDNQYDMGLQPLEDGEILVEEDGIQYVYTPDGEAYLYLVTEEYTGDTVVVPEGVTAIANYAFGYENNTVKEVILSSTVRSLGRGFDSSSVERVVLNEGLEQIDSRAFRSTPNLKEVVISSTVKTIADNAFQKSGIEEIVIPANVETVGEAAFGASKIAKVTFEGNTSVQGYAFRGCPNLRTVVMMGDDVTFIPSTLNGRNSMWFCNGESNNPNTSNITFYVENETVAERVKTAMGAEANNTKIYVDGKITIKVNSADDFADTVATATAGTVVDATGVTLVPTGSASTTVSIPAGVTVKGANFAPTGAAYLLIGEGDEPVVFEGCSFDGVDRSTYVIGTNGCGDVSFTNCAFDGQIMPNATANADATFTFDNCTFGLSEGSGSIGYVNCMGGTHIFTNCTFDFTGGATYGSNQYTRWNAVNSYSERYSTAVILEGCTFINCGTQRCGGNSTLTVK